MTSSAQRRDRGLNRLAWWRGRRGADTTTVVPPLAEAGLGGSADQEPGPPLLGRKPLLLGLLTSGLVVAGAAQPFTAAAAIKPIAATEPPYAPKWLPLTPYVVGQQVISPNNDVVSANVAHTSSADYATDAAKWTLSPTYARRDVERAGSFPRARGALVITIDDGYPSWHQFVAEANARRQRLTLCVTTSHIGAAAGYNITAQDIATWHSQGHEIASHSVTHPHIGGLAVSLRVPEYDNSKATLEGIVGAGNVVTFAYPFGGPNTANRTTTTDAEICGRYERLLDTGGGSSRHTQNAMPFLIGRDAWVASNHASMLETVRSLASRPEVVALFTHGAGDSGIVGEINMTQFIELLDLAASLGVPVLTAAEAFPAQALRNPSFERGLGGWRTEGSGVSVVTATPDIGIGGTRAAQLVTASTTDLIVYQQVPVTPGVAYTLSCRAQIVSRTGSGGFIGCRIRNVNYAGDSGGWAGTSAGVGAAVGTWTKQTHALTAAIPMDRKMVQLEMLVSGESGVTALFDHVWFGPTSFGDFG
jgi:peptidoglycan/xylan/chitin deacetylase (PgdA/CDA1 family)